MAFEWKMERLYQNVAGSIMRPKEIRLGYAKLGRIAGPENVSGLLLTAYGADFSFNAYGHICYDIGGIEASRTMYRDMDIVREIAP